VATPELTPLPTMWGSAIKEAALKALILEAVGLDESKAE
jgi:hypothetical protein